MSKISVNLFFQISAILAVILLLSACTSQRKQGELSGFGQFYQNTTAYYNGYFNANELYQESILRITDNYQDNFNEILAIFPYQAAQDVRSEYSNLDLAAEKVSTVVALRRPSHWTDDSYLMLAKCQFVKKDYESAEKTLQYLVHHFSPTAKTGPRQVTETRSRTAHNRQVELNRKKTRRQVERERKRARRDRERARKQAQRDRERGRAVQRPPTRSQAPGEGDQVAPLQQAQAQEDSDASNSGLFGHEPAYNEAKIWLAKTFIERDNFSRASHTLEQLKSERGLSDELRAQLHLVEAHLHITRSEYQRAIPPLETAIPLVKNRRERARYSFILGQLYQQQGNHRIAGTHFENAANWTNDFELEFNANLNQALATQVGFEGSLRELERFASDRKNADFRDQIYFTIGQLLYQQNQYPEAIAALDQALEHNNQNTNQRIEIYYLLGKIHLQREEFAKASEYYNLTMSVMSSSDSRYKEVNRLATSLREIATYFDQLQYNDSLLIVASLSEEEQRKWAERQFRLERKRQESAKPASSGPLASSGRELQQGVDLAGRMGGPQGRGAQAGVGPRAGQLESNFFAYDERQVRRGVREFDRKFGNRELVDDWRRSSSPIYLSQTGAPIPEDERVPERIVPESKIEEYLAKLPGTDVEKLRIRQNVIDALFYLGVVFRDKMENYRVSADYLERLTTEFENTSNELEGLYYLYLDYRDLGLLEEKERVKERIIRVYPSSKYAMVLKDPNSIQELLEKENRLPNYYRGIYEQFQQGKFEEVQRRVARSVELFGSNHEFSSKIALLNAMTMGNILGREAYVNALQEMIAQHPNTAEEVRAREILRFLQGDAGAFERYGGEIDIDKFVHEPDKMHYIIIVLHNSKEVSLSDAQIAISNFNQKYYKLSNLRISNHFLDTQSGIPLILIRSFNNKSQGMRYLNDAKSLVEEFLPKGTDFEIYPITQRNYREVLRERSAANYQVFFEQNYR
jgi:tetratricopeptide (TPR) repeat protein